MWNGLIFGMLFRKMCSMEKLQSKNALILFDFLTTILGIWRKKGIVFANIFDWYTTEKREVALRIQRSNYDERHAKEIDVFSTIFLDVWTLWRWRCVSGKLYRLRIEYLSGVGDGEWKFSERIVAVRIGTYQKCGLTFFSELAFNLFHGQLPPDRVFIQSLEKVNVEDISFVTEVKMSLIRQPEISTMEEDFNERVQRFFKIQRVLKSGDLISLPSEDVPQFFRITFDCKNEGFVHFDGITCYQSADSNFFFPRQRIPSTDFIPFLMHHTAMQIHRYLAPYLHRSMNGQSKLPELPAAIILLTCTADGSVNVFLEHLCDILGVNLIETDCLEFWQSDDGHESMRKVEVMKAKIKAAFERASSYVPCIHWIKNAKILNRKNIQNDGFDLTITNLLAESMKISLPSMAFVVTSESEHSEGLLPPRLAQMAHFEFELRQLEEKDRKGFFEFYSKIFYNVKLHWLLNITRGFSLIELDQMLMDATQNALITNGQKQIGFERKTVLLDQRDIELAVQKRNKALGELLGLPHIPKVTWNDIGGLEDVKALIEESLEMNLKQSMCQGANFRRSGIVLYGPPGCGKTLVGKAVANQFQMAFLSVKGPELLNQYVGQSESNLREVFQRARRASPSVLFFDEFDSLAPNRGVAGDSAGVMDRMVSQLLTELDSLQWNGKSAVFVMAATNRPDLLDPCLLVPGRFDKCILIKPADDLASKSKILYPIIRKMKLEEGLTAEKIALKLPELISGAEIQAIMSNAAMNSIRETILRMQNVERSTQNHGEDEELDILVSEGHIESALCEFKSSIISATLKHYTMMENIV